MLAVDVGNTSIKMCRFSPEGEILWRDSHPTTEIDFEFARSFVRLSGATRVIASSVVKAVNVFLEKGMAQAGAQVRIIDPATDVILPNRLATPQTTGTDRLLSALAAHYCHPGQNIIVLQAGTALTVDCVDADGVFRGGFILPGPQMWLDSLSSAAQLPYFPPQELNWAATIPGDSTRTAILHGAIHGLTGAAREAVAAHRLALAADSTAGGAEAKVVVTGGWGVELSEALEAEYRADLVLRGLFAFGLRNPLKCEK